ncbi:MAG TPA: protocatechuate 3,4-dioxygenase subunit beta [Candidatus Acidoferrales bacterium]|nr:protocatechuate 3,4-dioxygenase subunit beta [Candidatus Acidoferrales bacterium]
MTQPPYDFPAYRSSIKRAPKHPLIVLPPALAVNTGPGFEERVVGKPVTDLTRAVGGEALGERIIVAGRVLDEHGTPVRQTLVEVWQANAAGRYRHDSDQHHAPLDPHFAGTGHALTDDDGGFRFLTIKPGPYPWANHDNAWRPSHVHFSVFGPGFGNRIVTQMYFPGDPLLPLDPIVNSIADAAARSRLIARFDHESLSEEGFALGYRFDIVLGGRDATPTET